MHYPYSISTTIPHKTVSNIVEGYNFVPRKMRMLNVEEASNKRSQWRGTTRIRGYVIISRLLIILFIFFLKISLASSVFLF